jgi:hypothetical protein
MTRDVRRPRARVCASVSACSGGLVGGTMGSAWTGATLSRQTHSAEYDATVRFIINSLGLCGANVWIACSTFDALIFGYCGEREADLRRADPQRIHSEAAPGSHEAVSASQGRRLSIRQSARSEVRTLGCHPKKMVDCRWLKPALIGQFGFVESTAENHLRHTRFMGLRDDKKPKDVVRER